MLKTECLFSGSKGNSILVQSEKASVLIDAGVSCKAIKCALDERNVDVSSLKGILVTHEHSDHVKAVGRLCSKFKVPIYATEAVAKAVYSSVYDKADEANAFCEMVRTIRENGVYEIEDMTFSPFPTPHDSVGSVGYVIGEGNEKSLAVATDIGFASESVREAMLGCKKAIVESNHDVYMLKNGRYPEFLKERILSNCGHLSNDDCAELCKLLIAYGCTDITLFHMSEDNNTERIAFMTTYKALLEMGVELKDEISLSLAPKSVVAPDYRILKALIGQLNF